MSLQQTRKEGERRKKFVECGIWEKMGEVRRRAVPFCFQGRPLFALLRWLARNLPFGPPLVRLFVGWLDSLSIKRKRS